MAIAHTHTQRENTDTTDQHNENREEMKAHGSSYTATISNKVAVGQSIALLPHFHQLRLTVLRPFKRNALVFATGLASRDASSVRSQENPPSKINRPMATGTRA